MIAQYHQQTSKHTVKVKKPLLDTVEPQRVSNMEHRLQQLQALTELQSRQIRRLESQVETLTESLRRK